MSRDKTTIETLTQCRDNLPAHTEECASNAMWPCDCNMASVKSNLDALIAQGEAHDLPDEPEVHPRVVTVKGTQHVINWILKEDYDLLRSHAQALASRLDSRKWISVDERLPEKETCVIVAGGCGFWNGECWWTYLESPPRRIQWEVTHWMPLPASPKEP